MTMTIEPHALRGRISAPAQSNGEGIWRLAAYWLAAGALGGIIRVDNLLEESAQPEKMIVETLGQIGCAIDRRGSAVRATYRSLRAPGLIDIRPCPSLLPTVAAVACFAGVATEILARIEEADRMRRLRDVLAELGGIVRSTERGLFIRGITLRGGTADARGDPEHAMAAAIAACACATTVAIRGAECIQSVYPDFFEHYRRLGGQFVLS